MKPSPFAYHAPHTLEQALKVFDEVDDPDDVKVLAGGQSLMPLLALRLSQPEHLVDVNGLAFEHGRIGLRGDVVELGALVRQRQAERSAVVAEHLPLLAEALPLVAHPQIRNRGTLGGTIVHADSAAEFPTIALAMDAVMVVAGRAGVRTVGAHDFFRGFMTTALESSEILLRIDVPLLPPGTGTAFLEVSRRHGDFAMVGVAAAVTIRDGRIEDARLAFSGVAQTPVRASAAEQSMLGCKPVEETVEAAVVAAVGALAPSADTHGSASYRRHVAGVIARKALTTAIRRVRT